MTAPFFFEMGWKSALIAAVALLLAGALRSRAAADRALVLRIGIFMLLALPLIAVLLPALQVETWAAPEAVVASSALVPQAAAFASPEMGPIEAYQPTIWDDPTPLVLLAYFGGLFMAGARLVAGLWTLGRWTRAGTPIADAEWLDAFERAREAVPGGARTRLLVSDMVPSPLSWGWLRPVILIDRDSLDMGEDAEAIVAHEMAHIARGDWAALMLARVAAALFWFNPLVWRLEREVVQQAEEAADFDATDRVEPTHYAQALLSWAEAEPLALPANSIAPAESALGRRVRAVLDRGKYRAAGSAATMIATLLCIGLSAPVAAVELVEARAPTPPAPPAAPMPVAAPLAPNAAAVPQPLPAAPQAPAALAPVPEAPPTPEPAVLPKPVAQTKSPVAPAAPPSPVSPPAPVSRLALLAAVAPAGAPTPPARPARPVDVDTLVAMRVQGVTGEFVAAMAALGDRFARLSPDQLIQFRIHGVSPGFIRSMAGAGYDRLSPEQLVTMRIHGVDPSSVRRAIRIEGARPSADRLIEMTIHGEL